MGQKVNPIAARLGVHRGSLSIWYESDKKKFAEKLINDKKVRDWLRKELSGAGVGDIIIERQNNKAGIIINATRPGVVIGKKGEDVEKIKTAVSKIVGVPVQISIQEIKKPELHARLVAETIAQQLEKRVVFRRAMKRAVTSTLRLGALGVKVCVAGRLGGAEIARTEWYKEGRVPLHTFRADIDYGVAEALTTYGIIGVKVWIYKGDIYSDKHPNKFAKETNQNSSEVKTEPRETIEPKRAKRSNVRKDVRKDSGSNRDKETN